MSFHTTTSPISSSSAALHHLSLRHRQRFCQFGNGPKEHPSFPTVIHAFEHMAIEHPNLTAATMVLETGQLDYQTCMSYSQLNFKANQLASVLHAHGVTNGDAVCLFLKRSLHMLIAILATLKVGACYVPQHVGLAPGSQLLSIAKATKSAVVLTINDLEHQLPAFPSTVSVITIEKSLAFHPTSLNTPVLSHPVVPSDRCYIIFTSGTTGAPKGVQVTHENVANVLLTTPMHLGMAPGIRVSQILSIAFDMAAWEILGCLSHGATLIVRNRSISNALKHADVIISTPTVLGTIDASQMRHVKTVAVAGEPCPKSLAEKWGNFARFYNCCGPTETTIVNTAKLFVRSSQVVTIGKPTPNNTVYVLDTVTRQACKIGEVGEMWAGGKCVSQGYLGRPDLTAERYTLDPFVNGKGHLMYKTGDLGRWDENGELEHFGRVDDQVKIRGFRVELDGVSAVIEQGRGVTKAVVLKVGDELVAYVTPCDVDERCVKESVSKKLAYYSVPARIVRLDELPMTRNGKVDKCKLRAMSTGSDSETERGLSRSIVKMEEVNSDNGWQKVIWAKISLVRGLAIYFAACQ